MKLGLAILALIASPLAQGLGWYGGINIGEANSRIDDTKIMSSLLAENFSTTSITDGDRALGYKIFGGYQLNRFFALEGGYFDLGEFGFRATTAPAGTLNGHIEIKGLNLDIVGIAPITEKVSAFVRAGVNHAKSKASFAGTGFVHVLEPNFREDDTNYKFGFGFQYSFTESFEVRVEEERYRINDALGNMGDIDLVSIGLIYRFGWDVPGEALARQPAALIKVTFSVDSLFDFDQSTVKPAGKIALDKFVAKLKGTSFDLITITGHTDRISSPSYNIGLSLRRAGAVEEYLMKSGGIRAGKIATKLAGGAYPVTKPGECVGEKKTKALITCLQPDRRVEVDVSGAMSGPGGK